jgi:hypothetical protein
MTLPSDAAPETVACTRCGTEWPVEHYYRHPHTESGRVGVCRECIAAAAEDKDPDRQRKRAWARDYYRRRMEEQRQMGLKWRAKYFRGHDE